MRLIVTRPAAQAAPWVTALSALGHDAVALPLIAIAQPADPAPVQALWQRLGAFDLAVFVSANAVRQFFALAPDGAAWPPGLRAGSTGPGTSAALRAAGIAEADLVEPAADAAAFESEALWDALQARGLQPSRVLIVRGDGGRAWLSDTLHAHGAQVTYCAAYQRQTPVLDGPQRALLQAALATPAAHLWLFSSSEALQHLHTLAPGADWSRSRAAASHPRIVLATRAAGFGEVLTTASTPASVSAAVTQALAQSAPL